PRFGWPTLPDLRQGDNCRPVVMAVEWRTRRGGGVIPPPLGSILQFVDQWGLPPPPPPPPPSPGGCWPGEAQSGVVASGVPLHIGSPPPPPPPPRRHRRRHRPR